jgi:hypothetical protein
MKRHRIGPALPRKVIARFGGMMRAGPTCASGSRFVFTLPTPGKDNEY